MFIITAYRKFFISANSVDPEQCRPVLQRLIQVYTVGQCTFYGKLGINGLRGQLSQYAKAALYVVFFYHCSIQLLIQT